MYSVVVLFVVLVAVVSLIALCYHTRRNARRNANATDSSHPTADVAHPHHFTGADGLLPRLPPGARVGVVAGGGAGNPHIIIVGVPPGAGGGGAGALSAERAAIGARLARQLLPNGKLPTPPGVIANLPTYEYTQQPQPQQQPQADSRGGNAGGRSKDGDEAAAGGGVASSGAAAAASAAGANDDDDDAPSCVICCDAFVPAAPGRPGTIVKLLPCMHAFCAECIDAWLARDHTCPICKESILRAAGMSDSDALDALLAAAAAAAAGGGGRRRADAAAAAAAVAVAAGAPAANDGGGAAAGRLALQQQQQRLVQLIRRPREEQQQQQQQQPSTPPHPPSRPNMNGPQY